MSSFASVLQALGQKLGIAGLSLDAKGCCRLVFDGKRMLELRASNPQRRLVMSILCDSAFATAPSGVARTLLQANHWGAATGGGWFAVDEKGRICLQQEVMLSDEAASLLLARMQGMLNSIELWEKRLVGATPSGLSAETAAMARMTQRV